jgi:hypothetical protein
LGIREFEEEDRGKVRGGMRERYLSNVVIPVLCPDADFYCFLHEAGGDDDRIDGSLCRAGRHD